MPESGTYGSVRGVPGNRHPYRERQQTDVTEFNVRGQKLYLPACMELYNGQIFAYRMARRPVFELVSNCVFQRS